MDIITLIAKFTAAFLMKMIAWFGLKFPWRVFLFLLPLPFCNMTELALIINGQKKSEIYLSSITAFFGVVPVFANLLSIFNLSPSFILHARIL